ncbi:MAG: dipeptide epimerase [Lysobacteraceae bacterium]
MKIVGARIARLHIPLRTPFVTALRRVDAIDDRVLLLVTDAGLVGWGSAAATARITGETHGSLVAAWRGHLLPAILGADLEDGLEALGARVASAMVGNPSAKAAIEIALHDLEARRRALPLAALLGSAEAVPAPLASDLTISAGPTAAMVADAEAALARGFRALKLKVGTDPAEDLVRLRALHAAVAGRASLRIDVNQGWTADATVRTLATLEDEGRVFELVEQPVPADDLDGMAWIRARIATPLLADECVFSPADAKRVIDAGAADLINLQLMKAGGLRPAARIADLAREGGLGLMVGCMLESPIGVAAAAHFAAALGIDRVDLDPPALATHDPLRGNARFDGPAVTFHAAPGLGLDATDALDFLPPDPSTT